MANKKPSNDQEDLKDRLAIHAYLTPTAHAALHRFSEENRVTVTGLMQALCMNLHEEMEIAGDADIRQDWVKKGGIVDASRRRRNWI